MDQGKALLGFALVAGFGFFLEILGTHGGCYVYGPMYLGKLWLVPPCIVLMWGVLGWAAWAVYRKCRKYGGKKGVAAGLATPLVLDAAISEPLAFYTGLWAWTGTVTARVWFSTVGNYLVYVWVAAFAIYVYRKLEAPECRV